MTAAPPAADIVRPATPDDAPTLLTMIRELAEYERLAHIVTATEAKLRESLFGARPVAEGAVAEVAGAPAGYALFFHNFSSFTGQAGVYLEDVYVRPQHRGRGLGRKLLAHVAHVACQRGCPRFEWAVLDWNVPSIQFYQRLGARPLDDWTLYRLEGDALRHAAEAPDGQRS